MNPDISLIIKKSFQIKNQSDNMKIMPLDIAKAILFLYPSDAEKMINKCDQFLENKITKGDNFKYNLSPVYDLSDVYLIIRSFNFGKGHEYCVYYLYGLIMDFN